MSCNATHDHTQCTCSPVDVISPECLFVVSETSLIQFNKSFEKTYPARVDKKNKNKGEREGVVGVSYSVQR